MAAPRNNAPKTRGKPFAPGNSGRPKGSKHKVTLAVEALLDGEAERLTRKAINLGLKGNVVALRLCLERLAPPRKGRLMKFRMPPIKTSGDVVEALDAVVRAVASGIISAEEAQSLAGLLETQRRAIDSVELEAIASRIAALEQKEGSK